MTNKRKDIERSILSKLETLRHYVLSSHSGPYDHATPDKIEMDLSDLIDIAESLDDLESDNNDEIKRLLEENASLEQEVVNQAKELYDIRKFNSELWEEKRRLRAELKLKASALDEWELCNARIDKLKSNLRGQGIKC